MLFVIVVLMLSTFTVILTADAQLYADSNQSTTPEQFEECKLVGIEREKCSEQEILRQRCLGGPNVPCGGTSRPPELDPVVLSILLGSGLAFAISILTITKFRKLKRFS